jgi:hypothetical protein
MEKALSAMVETIVREKGLQTGYKHDASGTPNAQYFHGSGGILTMPGLDPQVFSTIVGIEPGILGVLPKNPSVFDTPYYETLTGVQDDTGSEPSTECADCVQPGLLKGCTLTSSFGRICRDTREILLERIGQRVNRSDPMDLQLMNLLGIDSMAPGGVPPDKSLQLELTKVLLEYGTSVSRVISQMVWNGNVANAVGTGFVPFNGFDMLITTGHQDAVSQTSCPSLDSDLKDFNYQLITATNPADIVQVMSAMVHFLKRLAETTGMMPVDWALVMRPSLFHELSQLWPCRYSTFGCNVTNNAQDRNNVNATEMVRERDRLRMNKVLPVEGVEIPVITDVGITEETNGDNANIPPGQMASDIYLIPLRVGAAPVTFMEFFQFNNPQMAPTLDWFHANGVWTTDNGMWFWTNARTKSCLKAAGVIRPRLILRTPQLAGRIQNVRYNPLQHERTPFPGDDTYFVDGGDTSESNWPL